MGTVCFCSFCTQHEIARFSLSRPSLPLSLKPRQRLTPTSSTEATVSATTATVSATTVWATGSTMARGRGGLSPTMATTDLATTDLATGPTATAMDFTTARGRLRPRLTLTTTVDTTAMDSAMATATVLATGPIGDKLL